MKAYWQLTLAQLRIFARNRQVLFFTLLFPIILMLTLGSFLGNSGGTSITMAVVDQSSASPKAPPRPPPVSWTHEASCQSPQSKGARLDQFTLYTTGPGQPPEQQEDAHELRAEPPLPGPSLPATTTATTIPRPEAAPGLPHFKSTA